MLIDQMPLSGVDAYLKAGGAVNIAGSGEDGAFTEPLKEGAVLDISGIEILLESDNLGELFVRQDLPLFSIHLKKEIYPGLFTDPYEHRVHTIAGSEDFTRGAAAGFQSLEVDGVPTLVSTGTNDESVWRSAIYKMSHAVSFDAIAWDLASSRLTPVGDFKYSVVLNAWGDADPLDQPATTVMTLASHARPDARRFRDDIQDEATSIMAYQIEFRATVERDSFLQERYVRAEATRPLGRPLLRAIYLLETVTPAYTFFSLDELASASSSVRLADYGVDPLTRMTAAISMPALLTEGESLGVVVHDDRLSTVQARLSGTVKMRPPIARQTGD